MPPKKKQQPPPEPHWMEVETSPLQSSNNANIDDWRPAKGKSIEEVYQKKTQLEHILLRPDTYIGSVEKHRQELWVYENEAMVRRNVDYVPGLYKIFDEILVNAADNKQRDPRMKSLKVDIDEETNCISVFNDGDGVPIEIHQEEKVYVPELIFGHLLTSSNYDDNEKKTTGGRNGYGAKLTNIFSTEFVIETADGKRRKKYKQVFSENMGKKSEPLIETCKASENWTKVTFKPDLTKFSMTHLEDDVVALMKKRVLDMAGCLSECSGANVVVQLNGKAVPIKSFEEYCKLYVSPDEKSVYYKDDRWKVCICASEGQFKQVSFVNGIATIKGGTHVDHIANQIGKHFAEKLSTKKLTITANNVKNQLWVFVNALIDNPAFDSQTKETLTLRQSSFGTNCELSPAFLKSIEAKTDVKDRLLTWVDFKQKKDLKKTDGAKKGRIHNIEKLEDANEAGGRNSDNCTLILTEGDSAKALAMAGLSIVGRDRYGVFPLRGKLLNVRDASISQVTGNAEISCIKEILGLQTGRQYTDSKSLRYGHLMIMTDQDHDGSHIKGLLINFIHSFWPSLLKIPSFLVEFITPIVKATHRSGKVLSFYTMPEYETWKESLGASPSGWSIKYYKGLGTSTSEEGKEYFEAIDRNKKDFVWFDEQDGEAIELAFSKKKIEARKNWLRQFKPGTFLDQKEKHIKYSDFVNKELILFSLADLQRSIPSMVDGLKPGQRKILFCAFKRNFFKEAKVAQFSGYVSEHSAYHHGEQSLAGTIIGMAQDFVGSNNINLFYPSGQFGSRLTGGKDHASARYIFTKLNTITRYLFPKDDDILLEYLSEDGQRIEPTWYVPIIPMVLVNGSEGIGTGWSTYIPNYNPRDIIANLRRLLNDEPLVPMHPWYRGFRGSIEQTSTKESGVTYTVTGIIDEVDATTISITELPLRRWSSDYKVFLESVCEGNKESKDPFIQDFSSYCSLDYVHFDIILSEEKMRIAKEEGLLKKFKLTTSMSTSNMHLFEPNGTIKKYDTPEQILEEFFNLRLDFYEKRKKAIVKNLETDLLKLENKVRFILDVVEGHIIVSNRKRADLFLELIEKKFTPFPKKKSLEAIVAGSTDDTEETEEPLDASSNEVQPSDYDYLLSMAIGTLTLEKVRELCAERDKLREDVDEMRKAAPTSLWIKDLDALEKQLDELDDELAAAASKRTNKHGAKPGARVPRKATKASQKDKKKASDAKSIADIEKPLSPMETDATEVAKTKAKAATKKAPPKSGKSSSSVIIEDDDEDDVPALAQRLAEYTLGSSPEPSDDVQGQGEKKKHTTRADDKNRIVVSDGDDNEPEDDNAVEVKKKAGKKAGNGKTSKPPAAPKKRGGANKAPVLGKVITEVLKPAESTGISPEKKVRKMRSSPFNKKSGSVLGRSNTLGMDSLDETEEQGSPDQESGSSTVDAVEDIVAPRATRPQRATRGKVVQILSDSESDEATDYEDDDDDDDDEY
ncbi:hypothetical protein Leryth_017933 [Lithospermum erythrorhizon]|nr:hypothetical protein Leryth_017933 [Lithospermum erythrorhizon]